MGKKRSKISKQKQFKAKHKQGKKTSLGGVTVTKGLSSKFQQANRSSAAVVTQGNNNNNNSNNNNSTPFSKTSIKLSSVKSKQQRKVFLSPNKKTMFLKPSDLLKNKNNKNDANDEQKDFQRQMASLQERQLSEVMKKKAISNARKNPSVLLSAKGFQPAAFSLQKTTQDLLHEAVDQMHHMSGVGANHNNFNHPHLRQPHTGSISLADLTPVRTNTSWAVPKAPSSSPSHNNAFAALQEDSDDDDNEQPKQTSNGWGFQQPSLTLAPASFSLLPRTTPTPATTPCRLGNPTAATPFGADDDVDPDL